MIPFISVSLSGSFSIMVTAFVPKRSTIFFAATTPIPLNCPFPRYVSKSYINISSGVPIEMVLNCLPYFLCIIYSPSRITYSFFFKFSNVPLQTIFPSSFFSTNTVNPFSVFLKIIFLTLPDNSISPPNLNHNLNFLHVKNLVIYQCQMVTAQLIT